MRGFHVKGRGRPPSGWAWIALSALTLLSCKRHSTQSAANPPSLGDLTPLMTIFSRPPNTVTGVAGYESCALVLADWSGRVLLIPDGGVPTVIGEVPGGRALKLESAGPGRLMAWSETPPLLARLSLRPFGFDSLPVAFHQWGERWIGPVVALGQRVATAPLGDPVRMRRAPGTTGPVRLIELRDSSGIGRSFLGPSVRSDSGYLPWLEARAALGHVGDTLLVALLEEGIIRRYLYDPEQLLEESDLPKYFTPVKPSEASVRFRWIQTGELGYVFHAPQVSFAAFSPSGLLYAVRPYGFKWEARGNAYVPSAGSWEPTRSGLEIYTSRGKLLAAYRLPDQAQELHIDDAGRLFILIGTGDVRVFQDPMAAPTSCHPQTGMLPPDTL